MEHRRSKRYWYIVIIIVIAVFFVGSFILPSESIQYEIENDNMILSHIKATAREITTDYFFTIPLQQVISCELTDKDPDAVLTEGTETRRCTAGDMESPLYGSCQVCLYQNTTNVILVRTEENSFLISFEDDSTTSQFYSGLISLLEDY